MTEQELAALTPGQREMLKQIDGLTAALSRAMDGQRRDVCMGALLNNIGAQMQGLRKAGDVEMLMRTALGCENAAQLCAEAVRELEARGPAH